MNNETVTISARAAYDLDYICKGNDYDRTKLIERLVAKEAEIIYQRDLRHEDQDHFLCQHQYLKLAKDGRYECEICGMAFEMTIPY